MLPRGWGLKKKDPVCSFLRVFKLCIHKGLWTWANISASCSFVCLFGSALQSHKKIFWQRWGWPPRPLRGCVTEQCTTKLLPSLPGGFSSCYMILAFLPRYKVLLEGAEGGDNLLIFIYSIYLRAETTVLGAWVLDCVSWRWGWVPSGCLPTSSLHPFPSCPLPQSWPQWMKLWAPGASGCWEGLASGEP